MGTLLFVHENLWPMTALDWLILIGTLGAIVGYGAWKNRKMTPSPTTSKEETVHVGGP